MDFEIICTADNYWNYLMIITDYQLGPDQEEDFKCDVFYIPRAFAEHTFFNVEETNLLQEVPEIMSGELIIHFSEAITTHAIMTIKLLQEDQEHQKFLDSQH